MRYLYIFFVFYSFCSYSQTEDAWVYFKDKPQAASYLSNPLLMLSQRALDRRSLQGIPLDEKDVPLHQAYIEQIAAHSEIEIKAKSKWFNCLHVRGLQANIVALLGLPFVAKIEFANRTQNPILASKTTKKVPRIAGRYERTTVDFEYGSSSNQIQMLNGQLLHQANYTGAGKIIAVMDGGFLGVDTAAPFARLRNNNQILGGYNYVNKSNAIYTGGTHGTSVLSLMGGYVENNLIGTAPDAFYYLYITEDGAKEEPLEMSNWVEAAEEADKVGADIINTSLGYTTFDNSNYNFTYNDMNGATAFISKGLDIAFSRGILCVVSAGNEGNQVWKYISAPADALNALAIGAVKADESYAGFSSIGPSADGRIKPDITAQGQNPYVSDHLGTISNTGSGTSYSGPIIAGMMACLWQALPNKTNAELKQIITQSSDRFLAPTPQYGYGIPDFGVALSNATLSNTNTDSDEFIVFPNPASDSLTVTIKSKNVVAKFSLFDMLGQRVLSQSINSTNNIIFIKSLSKGTYLYTLESSYSSKTGKIIKE